jgi:hypothetical protein
MKREVKLDTGVRLVIETIFATSARGTLTDDTSGHVLGFSLEKTPDDVVESACTRLVGLNRGDEAAALLRHWNATKSAVT